MKEANFGGAKFVAGGGGSRVSPSGEFQGLRERSLSEVFATTSTITMTGNDLAAAILHCIQVFSTVVVVLNPHPRVGQLLHLLSDNI